MMEARGVLKSWDGMVLDNYVLGSLKWTGLKLSDAVELPRTDSDVWLTPRNVNATNVVALSGEGERYLFYRGVAHLEALVQTKLSQSEVWFRSPEHLQWLKGQSATLSKLWFADIRGKDTADFREQQNLILVTKDPSAELVHFPLFSENDISYRNWKTLRAAMKKELVTSGLYEDEADAMLNTWKDSYFETPGLRVFYIVPKEWLDYFLPLQVSVPHQITRVFVGRIDLLRE